MNDVYMYDLLKSTNFRVIVIDLNKITSLHVHWSKGNTCIYSITHVKAQIVSEETITCFLSNMEVRNNDLWPLIELRNEITKYSQCRNFWNLFHNKLDSWESRECKCTKCILMFEIGKSLLWIREVSKIQYYYLASLQCKICLLAYRFVH